LEGAAGDAEPENLGILKRSWATRLLIRTTRKLTLSTPALPTSRRRAASRQSRMPNRGCWRVHRARAKWLSPAPISFGRLHVLPVVADFLALFSESIPPVLADSQRQPN